MTQPALGNRSRIGELEPWNLIDAQIGDNVPHSKSNAAAYVPVPESHR